MISYKYPIFPDKITQQKLAEALDACRWLYNNLLEKMNEAREKGITLKTYDTQNMIPSLKLENPKLNLVYSKVLQMVNHTLWSNIKGLAASKKNGRKIGHVRFKGFGWYNTLNYNQSGFKIDQDRSLLHLSKIGDMQIKLYREIEGCIKAVIIKREDKRWFAIVQADQEPQMLPETGEAIGLDVGLTSFVVDSEGSEIENPRCAEQSADKLAKLQAKLARAVKGSNNYRAIKDKIAKLHKRINCQRDDFLHKLSRMYVNNFDIICVEDLDVKGLTEKGHNNGMHQGGEGRSDPARSTSDLFSSGRQGQVGHGVLQKDAFLVFRALCKLSIRTSDGTTGTDLTSIRGKVLHLTDLTDVIPQVDLSQVCCLCFCTVCFNRSTSAS